MPYTIRSYLKKVFCPNFFVCASFPRIAGKLGPAANLNQNPFFEMASIRKMKTLLASLIFFPVLVCLIINVAGSVQAADKKPASSHLTILGLAIGDCNSRDIYSKLGPGIPFKDEAKADVTQVCFISNKDETLILFSFENYQCSRVRLLSQKKRFYKWHFCETSPLVSRRLATESGIKLGMSKSRLKAILGAPHSESDENMKYIYEWKQKRNTAETQRDSQDSRDTKDAPHRTVKATIHAEFSDAKLISFDVSKISQ
jgi:hypothetical protein